MTHKVFNCDICNTEGKIMIKDNSIKSQDIRFCPMCGSPMLEDYDDEEDE